MNKPKVFPAHFSLDRETLFVLFKYSVYILLAMDIYHFFVEDYAASAQTFAAGIDHSQIIEAFTATIDTAAWVILLLLFELETSVLEDERIVGKVKWTLHGIRVLCYGFIIYSFYGYVSKLLMLHNVSPFEVADLCNLIGSHYTYIEDIDEYLPLTMDICRSMNGVNTLQISGTSILSTASHLVEAQRLSIVEVVNSGNWLLIVAILEIDVLLQLRGALSPRILRVSKGIKAVLYSILFLAAAYWGWKGDFLDFWDAFLWLAAFIFIEMNIFQWNAETTAEKAA